MSHYTLLLSSCYEPIKFIPERRTIKLFILNKVDSIYFWNYKIVYEKGSFNLPSVLKLKTSYRKSFLKSKFSREAIIKRDRKICQFCGLKLCNNEVTIDHIIPLSRGGSNSFTNCVVACRPCNDYKADISLEQCGLKLIKSPEDPGHSAIYTLPDNYKKWNNDWDGFIHVM